MQRRLAAILFADLVGYSRLMGADEEGTHRRLVREQREFIEPLIADHQGRLVRTQGDGYLIEFGSVVDAVTAAVRWQEELRTRQADLPADERLVFRIGINVGDIIVDGQEIYGDGVNVASRLEALAHPGGVLLSDLALRQLGVRPELRFEDLGERRLKNIAEPLRVHRVVLPESELASVRSRLPATSPKDVPARPSIAVLPFVAESPDASRDYLADGITDDLITALSQIHWFFVIARNSTFVYKGESVDVQQVANDLGVRYVLEGSVQSVASATRVHARLADGETGRQLWAQRFAGSSDDIFEIQDEITNAIVGEVEPELGKAERARASVRPPHNLDAWETYQRGMWHLYRYTKPDLAMARSLFAEALDMDDRLAAAHSGMAEAMYYEVVYGHADDPEGNREAGLQHARAAVELEPEDAAGHCTLGRIHSLRRTHDLALLEFDTCLDRNPSLALAHYGKGAALVFSGGADRAFPHLVEAERLSPFDPNLGSFLVRHADASYLIGEYEDATIWAKRSLQQPGFQWSRYAVLIAALGRLDRLQEATEWTEVLRQDRPDFSIGFVERTHLYSDQDALEDYLNGLRAAGVS